MKALKYILSSLGLVVLLLFGYMKIADKNFSELALDIFSSYKNISGNRVQTDEIVYDNSSEIGHEEWTTILQKHVSSNGDVDYKGIQNEAMELEKYLSKLSNNPPLSSLSKNTQLAYWINAYNAFTVKLIIDHYPLKSIKDISAGLPMVNSPWDIKFFKIGGVDFDLNTIEHDILRKQFDEPRIHFAINCASISCPNLRNEAYIPEKIDFQLQEQATHFINNPIKNKISKTATRVSSIFNWFRGDFTKKESLREFLSQYNPNIDQKNKVSFLEYDWSLNAK